MADPEIFDGAIGIDLGTTYSCVAAFVKDKVEIIPNSQGNRTTPSYVAFTDTERLVGDPARNQIAKNPTNTVYDAKRLIGRKFKDKEVQNDLKTWPFQVVAGDNGDPCFQVQHCGQTQQMRPEQISGLILAKLKETAEAHLGKQVRKAVVTVPAYFNDAQRTSTKVAGELAGLEVLRIINEPTAAALAYGLDRKTDKSQLVLVFDLGGGTFDASLIAMDSGVFEVKATSGNTHLGGQDFDDNLVKYCIQEFKKATHLDMSENAKAVRKLRTAVEKAKRALSSSITTEIEVDAIHEGEDLLVKVSRAKFEQLNLKLFEQCIKEIDKVLTDASVKPADVDEVVMVGGSSRIPKVQEMVAEYFGGKRLNFSINPDEAIAYGAAIQANVIAGSAEAKAHTGDVLLLDVAPLSIGLAADGGKFKVLIPRNATIPRKVSEEFTTVDDDQTCVEVEVYEGERPRASANHLLGTFELDGIQKAPAGEASIMVTFNVDANGVLNVTAEDSSSPGGKKAEITITNTNKLSSDQINAMVEEAKKFARDDQAFVKLATARAKYEEYLYDLQKLAEEREVKESLARALEAQAEWQEQLLEAASYEDIQDKMDQLVEIHQRMLETKEERAKRKRAEQDGELEDDAFSQPMLGAADAPGDDFAPEDRPDEAEEEEEHSQPKKRHRKTVKTSVKTVAADTPGDGDRIKVEKKEKKERKALKRKGEGSAGEPGPADATADSAPAQPAEAKPEVDATDEQPSAQPNPDAKPTTGAAGSPKKPGRPSKPRASKPGKGKDKAADGAAAQAEGGSPTADGEATDAPQDEQEKGVATAPEDPVAKKPKVAKGRKASKEIVVADDES
uniref:Heat shock 70 kDa protein n=1 Tax=Euglena gracilis TaxID=3039 RepID=A0AA51U9G7_EUGGR|nr:heat shock 70 kDa protein [Euglena gracilis]BDX17134.1 heat shock 70 kDa protein family A 3 [Euglena gracilis]